MSGNGDYISREAAIDNVISQMRASKSEECMRERILNLDAADVRPAVRGEWVYDIEPDMFRCSVCNGFAPRNDYPFCHWCGADMRGKRE